jgi:hypothetical protein
MVSRRNRVGNLHRQIHKLKVRNIMKTERQLHEIASEIRKTWAKPYFGAVPYLRAMLSLGNVGDSYGFDDARSIVNYFLCNASTWRGEDARRIKAELKGML